MGKEIELTEVFLRMSTYTLCDIIEYVYKNKGASCSDLLNEIYMNRNSMNHQLLILKNAGILETFKGMRKHKYERCDRYRIKKETIQQAIKWLSDLIDKP